MSKVLMKGNEAIAEAAIQAGCRFFFGYPITPQNQIPEYMSRRLPEVGGTFVQAESEIAAINMVYGAAGAGARVMTSSSSPGISLKQEGISYIAGAELPAVIVNMTRGGPGLGSIQAAQSDYFQTVKGGGHGDYRLISLAPSSVQEACDLVQLAFDLSDLYRVPAIILGDGMLGQMMEPVEIRVPEKRELPEKNWATTGWDGHSRPRSVINSLYIEPVELERVNLRLQRAYRAITENEIRYDTYYIDDAQIIFTAYGVVARIVLGAVEILRKQGINAGLIRPITVWPFPYAPMLEASKMKNVKGFMCVEMNAGQMVEDVKLGVQGIKPVSFFGKLGGIIPTPSLVAQAAKDFINSGYHPAINFGQM